MSPPSTVHRPQNLEGRRQKAEGRVVSAYCLLLTAYCLLVIGTTGCVHRSLTIRTDPPGAMVYVNDQLKGKSPVTYDFLWYGWHRLTLRKEGFERLDDRRLMAAPMHLWIPFDLAMELLPFPVHDDRTWSYVLSPVVELPTPQPPATMLPTPPSTIPTTTAPASEPPAPPVLREEASPASDPSADDVTQPPTTEPIDELR
mgnify:CR=1 FL=1